jgi:hypothetical protein
MKEIIVKQLEKLVEFDPVSIDMAKFNMVFVHVSNLANLNLEFNGSCFVSLSDGIILVLILFFFTVFHLFILIFNLRDIPEFSSKFVLYRVNSGVPFAVIDRTADLSEKFLRRHRGEELSARCDTWHIFA